MTVSSAPAARGHPSNLIRHLLTRCTRISLDALTYAGNLDNLPT